jgi:hypothetical protein
MYPLHQWLTAHANKGNDFAMSLLGAVMTLSASMFSLVAVVIKLLFEQFVMPAGRRG